ncbi:LamG domain-containing protein [Blastopirellula sp. J2-11]|uniref:LamG domain-containing protein n=1 Tax=Blastopirellula sp. J2-11 TaxID=2943192 RepID=UPI0021C6CE22|nr:LamG domain-containing protein [Blastopirellula sp. J2-11]UUO09000.1 LamG domain-containing protein [Blastopirellula sp. J2-11]
MAFQSRFYELLALLLDDAATDAELDELVAVITADPAKLAQLKDHLVLSDRLSQYEDTHRDAVRYVESLKTRARAERQSDGFVAAVINSSHSTNGERATQPDQPQSSRIWAWVGLTVAASLVIALLSWREMRRDNEDLPAIATSTNLEQEEAATDSGVAVLTRVVGVVGANTATWHEGSTLIPQTLVWDKGVLQLEFYSGATVVAEGPASLEIVDPSHIICHFGKLRANIPEPAQGFTILSSTMEVVDLGTEFGMEISSDGSINVQVFEGKIELYESNSNRNLATRQELSEGKALAISADGLSKPLDSETLNFISPNQLSTLTSEASQRHLQNWLEHRGAILDDPRVIAYFPFDRHETEDRRLVGYAAGGQELTGAIVGAQWAEGRWPGKSSLEFKRPGDRVRISIPGSYPSLTLATWIRLDGLDRRFNSLLLTDEFKVNNPHWQIHQEGHLILGVPDPGVVATHNYRSPQVFQLQDIGNWVQIVTVYDATDQQVRHYLNGKLISSEPFQPTAQGALVLGDATIGNWSPQKGALPSKIRNFNGRMDELTVYGVALSGAQILELFRWGRP